MADKREYSELLILNLVVLTVNVVSFVE